MVCVTISHFLLVKTLIYYMPLIIFIKVISCEQMLLNVKLLVFHLFVAKLFQQWFVRSRPLWSWYPKAFLVIHIHIQLRCLFSSGQQRKCLQVLLPLLFVVIMMQLNKLVVVWERLGFDDRRDIVLITKVSLSRKDHVKTCFRLGVWSYFSW